MVVGVEPVGATVPGVIQTTDAECGHQIFRDEISNMCGVRAVKMMAYPPVIHTLVIP